MGIFLRPKEVLLVVAAVCGMATPCMASSSNGYGHISAVTAVSNGGLTFNHSGSVSRPGLPACASGSPGGWAIDASTPQGNVQLHTLLWAVEKGKRISVAGTGTCSIASDTETVASFTVEDRPPVPTSMVPAPAP